MQWTFVSNFPESRLYFYVQYCFITLINLFHNHSLLLKNKQPYKFMEVNFNLFFARCVFVCMLLCLRLSFVFFIPNIFIRYFIIFLSGPCLVDMDCMVSIGWFLIYVKSKGFYTGIFFKNVYYNWQCSFGLTENVKTKKNWSRVSDLYLSIITVFLKKSPPQQYITTIYLSVSS